MVNWEKKGLPPWLLEQPAKALKDGIKYMNSMWQRNSDSVCFPIFLAKSAFWTPSLIFYL